MPHAPTRYIGTRGIISRGSTLFGAQIEHPLFSVIAWLLQSAFESCNRRWLPPSFEAPLSGCTYDRIFSFTAARGKVFLLWPSCSLYYKARYAAGQVNSGRIQA